MDNKNAKLCVVSLTLLDGEIKGKEKLSQDYETLLIAGVSHRVMKASKSLDKDHVNDDMECFHINSELIDPSFIIKGLPIINSILDKCTNNLPMNENEYGIFRNVTTKIMEGFKILAVGLHKSDKDAFVSISVSMTHEEYLVMTKYLSEKSNIMRELWTLFLEGGTQKLGYKLDSFSISSMDTEELVAESMGVIRINEALDSMDDDEFDNKFGLLN